jgi:hypothetical protein
LRNIYILHLGNYLLEPDSGVAQKSFGLADAMRRAGRTVRLVAISDRPLPPELPPFLDVYSAPKKRHWEEAERFLSSLKSDDVVLFRYPFASQQLLHIVEKFGTHILFEHNTIEHAEMLLLQRAHFKRQPFSLRPSYLRYALKTLFFNSTEESELGGTILQKVRGGVCVSHEIMRYECSRYKSYRTSVIANGVEVTTVTNDSFPRQIDELRLVMLVGSDAVWHGYERLIHSLRQANLPKPVRLLLVGMDRPANFDWPIDCQHRVEWLGRKSKGEVASVLHTCHVAVGTLALYKKSMTEASPLKVRECLLMGLPMIIGYHDTDVSADSRFEPYLFQVPNNDSNIDIRAVFDWYTSLLRDEHHRNNLSALARETLSMDAKAKGYLEFFDTVFVS